MTRSAAAPNDWLLASPVSGRDLSLFRILYALVVLLTFYRSDYVSSLPQEAFDPPAGPFMLLPSVPPGYIVWSLQAALCLSLAALVLGWRTPIAGAASGVCQVVLYGIGYSFGQIDHTIFIPLVAVLLSFSVWGAEFSVDSHVGSPVQRGNAWAPRALAVALGVGMLGGGLAKILGGWLAWDSHAVFGYAVMRADVFDGPVSGTVTLLPTDNAVVWEMFDYATVAMECLVLIAALNWRAFYLAIAVLGGFHLVALVVLGIVYPYNLLVYAAFIPWARLGRAIPADRIGRVMKALATSLLWRAAACGILATGALLVASIRPHWYIQTTYIAGIVIGGCVGLGYLLVQAWNAVFRLGRRPTR